ncbi:MAG: sugar O-acetyltransferase, partial [Clostridia bacterium]|nr:sugar O-acetyltransferase [Clostridia bacterium]
GAGSVIGAGSIVTRDIPAGVLAAGNPCRVIRPLTAEDGLEHHRELY